MKNNSKIKFIKSRRVFDSRGNPTVEVVISTENGSFGKAISPSGASTGVNEAVEIRDNDEMFNPEEDTQWKFTISRLTYYPDPTDETIGYKFFHVLSPSDFEDQINDNSFVTMARS